MRRRLIADIRPQAQEDVDGIAEYIAERNPEAAARFLNAFDAAVDQLLQFPELAQAQVWRTKRPDRLAGVRRYVLRRFHATLFYRPTTTTLEVFRVLHHSQNVSKHLKKYLQDL